MMNGLAGFTTLWDMDGCIWDMSILQSIAWHGVCIRYIYSELDGALMRIHGVDDGAAKCHAERHIIHLSSIDPH